MWGDFKFGYREVIPDQSISEKWKEIVLTTGGTQSILQDVKIAERAGGYCYQNSVKYYTRNRFIYWRIYHDMLELVEQSLDLNLSDSRVRYRFTDTPLLDGITIYELNSNVIILIPTVCSVHVFTFPHPDRIHKQQDLYGCHPDLTVPSIFTEVNLLQVKDPSTYHIVNNIGSTLPHAAASVLNTESNNETEAIFLLTYGSVNSLLIRMILNTTQCYISELKQDSLVPRFLSGIAGAFRSEKNNDGQIAVSSLLHCIGDECFSLMLGRDGQLRVWSCNKGNCVASLDVLADTGDNQTELIQGSQNHMIRKSTDSNEYELIIGVFLCFANACQFQIFEAIFENHTFTFSRICTLYAPEQDLVDFTLDHKHLWVVWRGPQGDCTVTNACFERSNEAFWLPAILEPTPPRDYIPTDSSLDPRQAYSDYIFYPGRFPFFVITRALSIYKKTTALTDVSISPTLLKQRVCMAVEDEIQAEVLEYELSDDDYLEIANRCWSRFYSCCTQYNASAARPLGILSLPPSAGLVLLRKGTISILRPMEMLEHLVLSGKHTSTDQLVSSQLIASDSSTCRDLLQLISILVSIEHYLYDEIKSNIERELRYLRSPDQIIAELIEDLIADNSDYSISSTVIWELCRKASAIGDLYKVMLLLLQMLRLDKFYLTDDDICTENDLYLKKVSSMVDYLFTSPLGVSVVTETVHHMAIIRFSLCRNLLFLQYILLKGRQQDWSILESIRSNCMPDTVVFTQAYFTIVWLSETIASPVTLLESYQQRFSSLQLPMVVTSSRASSQRHTTLPELFILSGGGKRAHEQLISLQPDLEQLPFWHNSLLTYAGIVAKLLWPISGSLILGEWLLASGQHLILQQYVRQLSSWCEWNNYSRQFLLGVAFLANGERKKALDSFEFAANGYDKENFFINRLQLTLDSKSSGLIEYYLRVINLFEQYDAYDCAIDLAETAISRASENEPHLSTLHSIIFLHHLNLEHYEQAYHALDINPDQDRRKDCLRQLVGTLLDKKHLDILMKFPYVNIEDEFENIIEARARAMNLQDNFIYDFFYAYNINKANYRRAASVMYEQGLILSEINQEWALERQVKSYLTCLNCLPLVDKHCQYLIRPRAFVDDEPAVESVANICIPGQGPINIQLTDEMVENVNKELIFQVGRIQIEDNVSEKIEVKREVEILTIEDIKKELAHVTARLKLFKLSPQSQISCYSTPNELVGLLTNVGLFEVAANLCTVYKLPYESVFEALTSACLRLNENNSFESAKWLFENNIGDIALGESNAAKAGWMLLEHMLNKYEIERFSLLHKVVANQIIGLGCFLPYWLLASYKKRNPAELIQLFNAHGRLLEAYELCVEYVEAALGKGKEYFGLTHSVHPLQPALCLPTFTFCLILSRLKEIGEEEEKYKNCYNHFYRVLKTYAQSCK